MAGGDSALGSSLIGMSAAAASSAATALGVSAHTYHHSMMSPYSTAAAGYGCNMTSGKETKSNTCFRHHKAQKKIVRNHSGTLDFLTHKI